jgi:hypothetical protein
MVKVRGRQEVKAYLASLPKQIEEKLLRPAAKRGGKVIAEEAALRSESHEVAEAITVKSKKGDGRIIVIISVKSGWTYSVGTWLEWGTSPHFISVDESQRKGRSIGRINRLANEKGSSHSLVIGGKFVGETVLHPGARPHPFLRPALDAKGRDAVAAAQAYINARIGPHGITGPAEDDDE